MFKKIFSLLIIALMLFSIVSMSSAHTVIVKNKDSGNSQIAGTGHVKLYDTTFDVKKGATLTLNGVQYDKDRTLFLKFDTSTGTPAEFRINMGQLTTLENIFGQLTFVLEVREFNGRSRYSNKIDYVRVYDNKGNEFVKAGSPLILDNNQVFFGVEKFGEIGNYSSQGFHTHLTGYTGSFLNEGNFHNIYGKDYYFKDFPAII